MDLESTNERQAARIKPRLLAQPKSFDFYQATRLLGWLASHSGKKLIIKPKPNQSFPSTDIESIVETDEEYQLITNFLSLVTTDSPMPMHYLDEWLQQSQNDETQELDFLNIFHQRIYELLYETWQKYRMAYRLGQHAQPQLMIILNGITGLGFRASARAFAKYPELAEYARFFMPGNASPYNLQTLIGLCFNLRVTVESLYQCYTPIHADQYNRLGETQNQLGRTLYLGQWFRSVNSNLLIQFDVHDFETALDFMPSGKSTKKLQQILFLYLAKPLNCFLRLRLFGGALKSGSLGAAIPLGQAVCLGKPNNNSEHTVSFLL